MASFGLYSESVRSAAKEGNIVYKDDGLHDPYTHYNGWKNLLVRMPSNTRPLGEIGRLTLLYIKQLRQKTETLFLGPGAGRECFDARNVAAEHKRRIGVTTITLTPVAPDIALWERPEPDSESPLVVVPPFIDKQYVGNLTEMNIDALRADWIYDHFGPLFHGSAKPYNTDIDTPEKQDYRNNLDVVLRHASSTSCIVQERLNLPAQADAWEELATPSDVLMYSRRSAVLLRNARSCINRSVRVPDIQKFRDPYVFEDALAKTLSKLYDNRADFLLQQHKKAPDLSEALFF
jgi:hypothetical protein